MKPTIAPFNQWPRLKNTQPIFHSSNEAFFYAQLIYKDQDEQAKLQYYRDDCYIKLKHERQKQNPNLDYIFTLAVNAQLFRECLQECQRIKDEKFNP